MLKMFLICFLKPFLKGKKRSKFDFDHHFAFCKIGLGNTLFIFGKKTGRLFVCFVATFPILAYFFLN